MRKFQSILLLLWAGGWVLPGRAQGAVEIKGSGASSAKPLMMEWAAAFQRENPKTRVKYDSTDSRRGIEKWLGRGADFALTDNPLSGEQERRAGDNVLHLPLGLSAVAVVYNLPGIPAGLRLSPKILSLIFKGSIRKWNDPAISGPNPGFSLPDMDILPVHREDQSSLYDLFPRILYDVSPRWVLQRDDEKKFKWPSGVNAKGNEKTVERLRKAAGTLGTVDYSFAVQNRLPVAEIQNAAGNYVAPTPESIQAATSDWVNLPGNLRASILRPRDAKAYPLSGFLWAIVNKNYFQARHDPGRGKVLADFLRWAMAGGQKSLKESAFVPLPAAWIPLVAQKIQTLQYWKP